MKRLLRQRRRTMDEIKGSHRQQVWAELAPGECAKVVPLAGHWATAYEHRPRNALLGPWASLPVVEYIHCQRVQQETKEVLSICNHCVSKEYTGIRTGSIRLKTLAP